MEELKCEFKDCPEVKKGKDMGKCIGQMQLHHSAIHPAGATAAAVKSEDKERKSERQKMKPPTFLEKETREEFKRKHSEFETYSDRAHLKANEITEDLYHACETPLKRKLRSSNLIDRNQLKKTDPKVLLAEMERMCLPKLNIIVERESSSSIWSRRRKSLSMFSSQG